jgi:hypothetical protein
MFVTCGQVARYFKASCHLLQSTALVSPVGVCFPAFGHEDLCEESSVMHPSSCSPRSERFAPAQQVW